MTCIQEHVVIVYSLKCRGCGKQTKKYLDRSETISQTRLAGWVSTTTYEKTLLVEYWHCQECLPKEEAITEETQKEISDDVK